MNLLSLGASSWIGANDINTDYAWILADGHAMTYSNWKANEPNNAGTGGEDCVVVGSDGLWVDGPCDSTAEAVYESPYPISGLSCEQYAGEYCFACILPSYTEYNFIDNEFSIVLFQNARQMLL